MELVDSGFDVEVFEASRTLGGRARRVDVDGLTLDNGAHILVGAYRETLRLMQKVDAGGTALQRHPLHLEYAGKVKIVAPRLPAPLHLAWALLTATGLSWQDKFAAIRFMRGIQSRGFRLDCDITAGELFADQPESLRRYFWEPLCLAALNTPVAIASAQVFLNVLRDSLAADRAASDLLLPATDFSSLFPDPAATFIEKHGGRIFRSTRIAELQKVDAGWTAQGTPYDHIVLAVPPYHLGKLLAPHPECAPILAQVDTLTWQPIATVYLAYPAEVKLPFPMLGLDGGHAHWLFDRGALCRQPGLLAAVISGAGRWETLTHEQLAATVHGEIVAHLGKLPNPLHHWVIEEKRATFACTPNLDRPRTATPMHNLWLAGDYVASDYPATLEGAIKSGVAAATAIIQASPPTLP